MELTALVDLAAVTDGDHEDEQDVVVDLVHDPVVTGTNTPFAIAANQLRDPTRARVAGQQLDRHLDPTPSNPVQLA